MTTFFSQNFQEFPHGSYAAQRFDFCIDKSNFVAIFSEIDIGDPDYYDYRCTEAGFIIPANCYDIKFDRLENFETSSFYQPPAKEYCSRRYTFADELATALRHIVILHYQTYFAPAYFAIAETNKLKRFYDRVLQNICCEIVYKIIIDVGDRGMGYVLKTRQFRE